MVICFCCLFCNTPMMPYFLLLKYFPGLINCYFEILRYINRVLDNVINDLFLSTLNTGILGVEMCNITVF